MCKPFQVEKVSPASLPEYFQMKLVSPDPERRITMNIRLTGSDSQGKGDHYEIFIVAESGGFIEGVALLKGVARA